MTVKRRLAGGAFALITALAPAVVVPTSQVKVFADASGPMSGFVDVPNGNPYSLYIAELHSKGKISGYDGQHFGPNDNLTRAEFAAMLVKILDVPLSSQPVPFQDLGGAEWARQVIQAAYANNVIQGYDATHFGPNDPVTREQAAAMVWQLLSHKGVKPISRDPGTMVGNVSDWSKEAVIQALNYELYGPEVTQTTGYQPKKVMTRAEAAALFDTALNLINWQPGISTALGKAFFSKFKINGDGTVTVTIPTVEQSGVNVVRVDATYVAPNKGEDFEQLWVESKYVTPKNPPLRDLQPGQTYTLKLGNKAFVGVNAWDKHGMILEGYTVNLDGSWFVDTKKRIDNNQFGYFRVQTLLDTLLKGLGAK